MHPGPRSPTHLCHRHRPAGLHHDDDHQAEGHTGAYEGQTVMHSVMTDGSAADAMHSGARVGAETRARCRASLGGGSVARADAQGGRAVICHQPGGARGSAAGVTMTSAEPGLADPSRPPRSHAHAAPDMCLLGCPLPAHRPRGQTWAHAWVCRALHGRPDHAAPLHLAPRSTLAHAETSRFPDTQDFSPHLGLLRPSWPPRPYPG